MQLYFLFIKILQLQNTDGRIYLFKEDNAALENTQFNIASPYKHSHSCDFKIASAIFTSDFIRSSELNQ